MTKGAVLIGIGFTPTQQDVQNAIREGYIKNFDTVSTTSYPQGWQVDNDLAYASYYKLRGDKGWEYPSDLETMKLTTRDGRQMWCIYPSTKTQSEKKSWQFWKRKQDSIPISEDEENRIRSMVEERVQEILEDSIAAKPLDNGKSLKGKWVEIIPNVELPPARYNHLAVWDDEKEVIIVIGGAGTNSISIRDMWSFNTKNNTWTSLLYSDETLPTTTTLRSAIDQENRKVYVVGYGYRLDERTPISGMWIYSLDSHYWEHHKIPQSLEYLVANSLVLDTDGKQLFSFGGGGTGEETNELWASNLSNNTWSKLNIASPPPARNNHSAVWDPNKKCMYIFGGMGKGGNAKYNDLWIYSATSNSWKELKPSGVLPPPLWGHEAFWDFVEGNMYIFGGSTYSDLGLIRHKDLWVYKTQNNSWLRLHPSGTYPSARFGNRGVIDPKKQILYIFGGMADDDITNVRLYNDLWAYSIRGIE